MSRLIFVAFMLYFTALATAIWQIRHPPPSVVAARHCP